MILEMIPIIQTWTKTILATRVRVLSGIRVRLCMFSSSLDIT